MPILFNSGILAQVDGQGGQNQYYPEVNPIKRTMRPARIGETLPARKKMKTRKRERKVMKMKLRYYLSLGCLPWMREKSWKPQILESGYDGQRRRGSEALSSGYLSAVGIVLLSKFSSLFHQFKGSVALVVMVYFFRATYLALECSESLKLEEG